MLDARLSNTCTRDRAYLQTAHRTQPLNPPGILKSIGDSLSSSPSSTSCKVSVSLVVLVVFETSKSRPSQMTGPSRNLLAFRFPLSLLWILQVHTTPALPPNARGSPTSVASLQQQIESGAQYVSVHSSVYFSSGDQIVIPHTTRTLTISGWNDSAGKPFCFGATDVGTAKRF